MSFLRALPFSGGRAGRNVRTLLIAGLAILGALLLFRSGALRQVDNLLLDWLIRNYSDVRTVDPRVVLVTISDQTYEELGLTFPFPRRLYARFYEKMHRLGARLFASDVFLYSTSDRASENVLLKTLSGIGKVISVMRTEYAGSSFNVSVPISGRAREAGVVLVNSNFFYENNIVRSFPAWLEKPGSLYYSLVPEIYAAMTGVSPLALEGDLVGRERPWYLPEGKALRVGNTTIPLVGDRLFINYFRAPGGKYFESYSFEEIMGTDFPDGAFEGRTVIIGTSERLSHDFHGTPLGTMLGCQIHGILLRNLLDGALLYPLHPSVIIALVVLSGLLGGLVFPRLKPFTATGVFMLLIILLAGAAIVLYRKHIFLQAAPPFLTLTACYALISLIRTRELEKELDLSINFIDRVALTRRHRGDFGLLLSTLLKLSCENIGASAGWIQILDRDGRFVLEASDNCFGTPVKGDLDGGVCSRVLTMESHHIVRDVLDEPGLSHFEKIQELDTLLCIPLSGADAPLGVMVAGKKRPSEFSANEVKQMIIIGVMAGALIENVRLSRKNQELFVDAISSLAQAIDARDPYTFGHSSRVSSFGSEIARRLGFPDGEIRKIELAGLLHDIGKIGVPEAILQKSGPLSEEERRTMQRHPEIGVRILKPLDEIYSLLPLVSSHHEKLGGGGYPYGLKGEEIPLGGRILAVADVYDALTSERPYRKASTPQEAVRIIREQFGDDLDRRVLEKLLELLREKGDLPRDFSE